jgi:uncharacterized membrane protein
MFAPKREGRMRGGIWVLAIMAAVWAVAGIVVGQAPAWLTVVPVAISVVMLLWARRQSVGTGNPVEGDHVGRVIGIATAIEAIAIFVAANVLVNLHLPTLVMPAIAIIVGLHFAPLARWIPVPLYYWTGAGLVIVGLIAIVLPADDRAIATGIASALVLWISCILLVCRGRGEVAEAPNPA